MALQYIEISEIGPTVQAVRDAFNEGISRPIEWRKQQLKNILTMVSKEGGKILGALHDDLGRNDYLAGTEVNDVRNEAAKMLEKLDEFVKKESISLPSIQQPGKGYIIPEPLGVVLVISPWNYPFSLCLNPIIGAFAAGNTVILKPSEVSTNTSRVLGEIIPKYLDNDAIKVIQGAVNETTELLTYKFDHIFYTGSGFVGKIIMKAAAEHLTPVTLELGGKSPVYIDENINMGVALRRIAWGKYMNSGQTCIAPDYVLCHESRVEEFIEGMKNTILEFYGEDPKESPDFERIINDRHVARIQKLLEGNEENIIVGGEIVPEENYIAPTIVRSPDPESKLMKEEIFGPILPVLTVNNREEAIEYINSNPKPLSAYIFTTDKETKSAFQNRTSSGALLFNEVVMHYVCEGLPFGGVGESGMGAYHGEYSFNTFSHYKPVMDKGTYLDPSLRYPPYTESKIKWAKRLMFFKPPKNLFLYSLVILAAGMSYYFDFPNKLTGYYK
jgi:aldehyde dehydrogenase (NAD+)